MGKWCVGDTCGLVGYVLGGCAGRDTWGVGIRVLGAGTCGGIRVCVGGGYVGRGRGWVRERAHGGTGVYMVGYVWRRVQVWGYIG